ncbi:TniQ family protein [Maritimibacter fusiformis]|uniref:TniQ family protein n=1 Tax=Maritimibacter fusiformis TaxID=2603819 RepID=A0A5D0RHV7_9RHOB|nr:TniQ family protein [Maritimibacter fusiformis]TYB80521.1 TniQ family protein [Maritimibacter fusiformis]
MLVPHFPFHPEESPLSYAACLARLHTGDRLVSFLRDVGISPDQMAVNDRTAVSRLAEIAGVAVEDLCANAAIPVGKRLYDIRGELVTAEFLANPYTVFCPACLARDDETGIRRGRWTWTLSVVRTCQHHQIPLLRQASIAWDDKFHELDRRVPERGAELQKMIERAVHRSVSPLQDYVLRRLDGNTGSDWLDSQTLDQATRATELLGVLVAFGPAQKLPELTSDDWDRAGRVGFEFTSRGEQGIREALEAQLRKFDDATGTPGARKIFGRFYEAIAHSKSLKEPGDIARILRDVITESIALPAGTKVLGVELPERRLHTLASLAKEQQLDSRALGNVLIAAGVLPEKASAHYPIPVARGREIAARTKRIVHVVSLPDVLGCGRPLVDQLFADRLLTPIYSERPGLKGRIQKAVDREEVAMLVGDLHAKATELGAETDGLVPVSKAAEKAKVPAITVVHMILGGFLKRVVRLTGEGGITALRVDTAEVKHHAAACTTGLSPMEAFGALKIPKDTGWGLVDRCPEDVSLAVDWIVGPSGGHRIPRFDPATVAEFKGRFTHPARLAEQHDLQIGEVVRRLKRHRVRPALSGAEVGIDFYRVSDLKGDILS